MTRRFSYPMLAVCLAWATAAFAQQGWRNPPRPTIPPRDHRQGTIVAVISTRSSATLSAYMDVKTEAGLVKVHLGPAMFIGEGNFWFVCDEEVELTGAMVSHGGEAHCGRARLRRAIARRSSCVTSAVRRCGRWTARPMRMGAASRIQPFADSTKGGRGCQPVRTRVEALTGAVRAPGCG
jgi:hypothetical protein